MKLLGIEPSSRVTPSWFIGGLFMRRNLVYLAIAAGFFTGTSAAATERDILLAQFSSCLGPLSASAMSADGDQIAYAVRHEAATRYYKLSVVEPGAETDSEFTFTFPDQSVRLNRLTEFKYRVLIGDDACRLRMDQLSDSLSPEHQNAVATMVTAFIAETAQEALEENDASSSPSRRVIKAFLKKVASAEDPEESSYDDYNSILDALQTGGKSSGEPATVIGGSNNPWKATSGRYGLPSPDKKQQSWHQNEDGEWVNEQGYTQEEMARWDSNKDGWIDGWEYYVFSPFATEDAMESVGNWFATHGIWGWFQ